MKQIISIEELAMTLASFYFMHMLHLDISWWLYPILFLAPDISMVGYLLGNKAGAISYNLVHHKAVAIAVTFLGAMTGNTYLTFTGLILFGHSSFDRMMGYGLKYFDGFGHTHLGAIGKKA